MKEFGVIVLVLIAFVLLGGNLAEVLPVVIIGAVVIAVASLVMRALFGSMFK